ncbi:MAG TPA: site-2 protease family protein [Caulobacterales bacterium]|jgi:Zn-dependent protease|nr:site-2 protease family protein [Caulobacterales bacterium]
MERNGLRLGSFAGAPIILDWTVALLAGYWILTDVTRGGVSALPTSVLFVGAVLAAILAHEVGHAAMAAALRIPAAVIVLTFFGGYVQFVTPPQKRWHDMLVSAAGPGANLALGALIAFAVQPHLPALSGGDRAGYLFYYFLAQFVWVNVLLGLFNLLPGFPLDGGAILRAFLSYFLRAARARWIVGWTGLLIATAVAVWGLMSGQLWTAGIGALLAFSSFAEISAAERTLKAR